ncbi:hypothetical protein L798_03653 [Zootermopsis nevadensis]|uniref:Uncharacterized protein n=1 Tax=Zootermopsis nevadensis TaxID=136037 RepID=A0A067QI22_ZOONE|nr:hypothetical protein L798_03653 [Zootermopsis nevadensis]
MKNGGEIPVPLKSKRAIRMEKYSNLAQKIISSDFVDVEEIQETCNKL